MPGAFESLVGRKAGASPVARLVAFRVYDGPTAGVVYCDPSEAYYFQLMAWDDKQERRIFSLRPFPRDAADELVNLITTIESPRWPEWWVAGQASKEQLLRINRALLRAGQLEYIVLTKDLMKVIELCRDMKPATRTRAERLGERQDPEAEVSRHSFAEWLDFLREAYDDSHIDPGS